MNKKHVLLILFFVFLAFVIAYLIFLKHLMPEKVHNYLQFGIIKSGGINQPELEESIIEVNINEQGAAVVDKDINMCTQDDDCVKVAQGCGFTCGTFINRNYQQEYNRDLEKRCEGYQHEDSLLIYTDCQSAYPVCENGVCVGKPMEAEL